MTGRKLAGWAALALLLYYIATAPAAAGDTVKDVLTGAGHLGDGVIVFLKSLTSNGG
jgi:hypothetical protein